MRPLPRFLPALAGVLPAAAVACDYCRAPVRSAVYDSDFVATLMTLALPFVALLAIATGCMALGRWHDAGGRG